MIFVLARCFMHKGSVWLAQHQTCLAQPVLPEVRFRSLGLRRLPGRHSKCLREREPNIRPGGECSEQPLPSPRSPRSDFLHLRLLARPHPAHAAALRPWQPRPDRHGVPHYAFLAADGYCGPLLDPRDSPYCAAGRRSRAWWHCPPGLG